MNKMKDEIFFVIWNMERNYEKINALLFGSKLKIPINISVDMSAGFLNSNHKKIQLFSRYKYNG